MARKTKNNVQLGLFVTASVTLFVIAVYFIGNRKNLFGSTFRIHSVFNNVNGLQSGNNVRYSGIDVGTVENIVILSDSSLRVNMVLDESVRPFIKRDAIASIGSDGLVGNMLVNINRGNGLEPSVEDGDMIVSYSRIGADELLNTLGKTNENIGLVSYKLLSIADQINRGHGTIPVLLRDSLIAADLRQSVDNLKTTSAYLTLVGRQLHETLQQIQKGEGTVGNLLTDSSLAADLHTLVSRLDTVYADQMEPVILSMEQSITDISASSKDLKELLRDINAGKGAAGAILRDPQVERDLRETMQNLSEGSEQMLVLMEAMKHNFLFRKYFKKQAKKQKREHELETEELDSGL